MGEPHKIRLNCIGVLWKNCSFQREIRASKLFSFGHVHQSDTSSVHCDFMSLERFKELEFVYGVCVLEFDGG